MINFLMFSGLLLSQLRVTSELREVCASSLDANRWYHFNGGPWGPRWFLEPRNVAPPSGGSRYLLKTGISSNLAIIGPHHWLAFIEFGRLRLVAFHFSSLYRSFV